MDESKFEHAVLTTARTDLLTENIFKFLSDLVAGVRNSSGGENWKGSMIGVTTPDDFDRILNEVNDKFGLLSPLKAIPLQVLARLQRRLEDLVNRNSCVTLFTREGDLFAVLLKCDEFAPDSFDDTDCLFSDEFAHMIATDVVICHAKQTPVGSNEKPYYCTSIRMDTNKDKLAYYQSIARVVACAVKVPGANFEVVFHCLQDAYRFDVETAHILTPENQLFPNGLLWLNNKSRYAGEKEICLTTTIQLVKTMNTFGVKPLQTVVTIGCGSNNVKRDAIWLKLSKKLKQVFIPKPTDTPTQTPVQTEIDANRLAVNEKLRQRIAKLEKKLNKTKKELKGVFTRSAQLVKNCGDYVDEIERTQAILTGDYNPTPNPDKHTPLQLIAIEAMRRYRDAAKENLSSSTLQTKNKDLEMLCDDQKEEIVELRKKISALNYQVSGHQHVVLKIIQAARSWKRKYTATLESAITTKRNLETQLKFTKESRNELVAENAELKTALDIKAQSKTSK